QADPEGQVALQALDLPGFEFLCGEHEVDADGAADTTDGQEQVGEVGVCGEEIGELVADDQQVRQGVEGFLPLGPSLLVGVHVREVDRKSTRLNSSHVSISY